MNLDICFMADRGVALRLRESRSVARNVARNLPTNARLHCNSLFHGFTFLYAQGTDLRTGRVAISCFRPTHSARNVARLPLFQSPGSHSLSLQDLRHGPENRKSCYSAFCFCLFDTRCELRWLLCSRTFVCMSLRGSVPGSVFAPPALRFDSIGPQV